MQTADPAGVVFIDADDTLWENNRYFRRVQDAWIELAAGHGVSPARALDVLEECEDRNIPVTGYGTAPFLGSVTEAFGLLVPAATPDDRRAFDRFAREAETLIRDHPIDLLPGVAAGLPALRAQAHRLVVLTKGQDDEQRAKVERSGLLPHFEAVRVVPEKDVGAYRAACSAHDARPADCWMIGNSPASDVNPARLAGLRTILVPHAAPWHRELADLVETGTPTLRADGFAQVPELIRRAV